MSSVTKTKGYKKNMNYKPSDGTKQLADAMAGYGAAPKYESQYGSQINALMDKIVNRKDFSYDFNADALYQQYKDNYTALGAQAAQNATASAATQTGGYGNSYAATAATQANQQYMNQLNNVIPDLYNAALSKYNAETDNLYKQFSMYGEQEDRAFGQYESALGQWNADRAFNYGKYRDSVADDQWKAGFDADNYRWAKDYDTNNDHWQKEYDTNNDHWKKEYDRDEDHWKKEYDFSKEQWEWQKEQAKKKATSSGGSGRGRGYGGGYDATGDEGNTSPKDAAKAYKKAQKMLANGASNRDIIAYLTGAAKKSGNISSDQLNDILKRLKLIKK